MLCIPSFDCLARALTSGEPTGRCTQFYDAALRPSGLRITQFTLLQALTLASGISQKQLGELLQIDSTTLTRTLAPLRKKGWLRSATGTDRRELRLSLTCRGKT